MPDVPPKIVKLALEHCDPTSFEKYAQTIFGSVIGHTFKPLGGYKDGGADGFVDSDILEDVIKATVFFQASIQVDTAGKIRKTVRRLKQFNRTPRTLYYATSRQVSHIDKLQVDLSEELDLNVRVYDGSFFEQHANHNDDVKTAFAQYLQQSHSCRDGSRRRIRRAPHSRTPESSRLS